MGSAKVDQTGRFDARPKIPKSAPLGSGQVLALGSSAEAVELDRGWRLTAVP